MTVARKKALIPGASAGIGAVYADRFSRRGYDPFSSRGMVRGWKS